MTHAIEAEFRRFNARLEYLEDLIGGKFASDDDVDDDDFEDRKYLQVRVYELETLITKLQEETIPEDQHRIIALTKEVETLRTTTVAKSIVEQERATFLKRTRELESYLKIAEDNANTLRAKVAFLQSEEALVQEKVAYQNVAAERDDLKCLLQQITDIVTNV